MALSLEGKPVPHDRIEMLKAGFSTTSLPNALGSSVEKTALSVFLESAANVLAVARVVSASSFKAGKAIRLSATSKLLPVGPTGEIKHGDLNEDSLDYKVGTYARMFAVTREALINDDLSILSDLPLVLGAESARTLNDLFFDTLIANAGSFFGAGNGNLLTGAGSALSTAGLADAVANLRKRTDRDGRIIGFTPTVLMVPASLETTARSVLYSTTLQRDQTADQQPMGNPHANLNLMLATEARLDADSEAAWYLWSQPLHGAALLATLGGRMGAIVETESTEFNTLGQQWRAYMDIGVNLGEHRAVVKNAGS